MDAVQIAVDSALKRVPATSDEGLRIAKERLERAYAWLEGKLAGRIWAAGADFAVEEARPYRALFPLGAPDRD